MDEGEHGPRSFDDRLRAARRRQGLEATPSEASGGGAQTNPSVLLIGLRVGVELVTALAVAVGIGWWLDHWLHTTPVLLAVFVLLGGAAGVLNVWRLVRPGGEFWGRAGGQAGRANGGPVDKGSGSGE
jgi:ATP synthase protein I